MLLRIKKIIIGKIKRVIRRVLKINIIKLIVRKVKTLKFV